VIDTDIALAEADLLAGRPDKALARVDTALDAAKSIGAATLLPAAYRVRAAALLDLVDLAAAEQALSEGLLLSAAPEVAHERGFLRVVAARHARLHEQLDIGRRGVRVPDPRSPVRPSADVHAQAQRELESLGVVAAPLPWS
jgi:hypothetical protein